MTTETPIVSIDEFAAMLPEGANVEVVPEYSVASRVMHVTNNVFAYGGMPRDRAQRLADRMAGVA